MPLFVRQSNLHPATQPKQKMKAFTSRIWTVVCLSVPLVPIDYFNYPGESDPSPYPIPSNLPIEGWPLAIPGLESSDQAVTCFRVSRTAQ